MKKLLAGFAALFLLAAPVQAQTPKTKAALTTEINANFADNTTNAITAALLRTTIIDVVTSYVDWLTCTTQGGLVYWNGTATPTCLTAGTSGQLLQTLGGSSDPSWVNIASVLTQGTGITISGTVNATIGLTNTAVTPAAYGSATRCATVTVNAQGQITGASDTPCTPPFSAITGSLACSQMPAGTGDVTWSSGSCGTTIAANAVTNSKAAQMTAATIKMNPTAGTANATDATIQGLTSLAAPSGTLDFVPIYDHVTGTIKQATPAAITGASVSGVSSLNTSTGALTLANGNGIAAVAGGGGATLTVSADIASAAQIEAGTANKVLDAAGVYTAEVTATFNATQVLDFNTFLNAKVTLTASITSFTCSNQKASQSGTIRFIQGGAGSFTVPATFGCNMKFQNGLQPVLSTAVGAVDALVYSCSATNYCVASMVYNVQ